jgi:hypothetical protein
MSNELSQYEIGFLIILLPKFQSLIRTIPHLQFQIISAGDQVVYA